ncbi:hypothetical protein BASA81_016518 [Batrachochytrium salamandrivorans]|nr:hypothetical protein BASA81_016518 [Batrachochytrium salamandrivorans]
MKRAEQAKSPFLLVPTMFKLAGYRTLSMGKIFHTAEFKLADSEEVWSEPSWTRNAGKRPPALPTSFGREWLNSRDVPDDTYADGVLARLAAKMILEDLGTQPSVNTSKQPWFLGVGFYKPHIPFEAPKRYFDLAGNLSDYPATYGDGTIGNLVKSQSDIAKGAGCTEMSEYVNSPKSLGFPFKTNANVLREASRGYHASVMYMDAQLATKVPFIIASPLRDLTAKRNARSFAPVELLDFAPTLLEMAGLQPERYSKYREFEGKSLMPFKRS